ncbi:hypothetical protein Q7P37_011113 [Cladosporium fusiforme]
MSPADNKAVKEGPPDSTNEALTDPARRASVISAIVNTDKGTMFEQLEEAPKFTSAAELPSKDELIDALGIPDWKGLEKKIVRRLDMTLMPTLWVLYVFNYLDRASLAQARLSSIDEDLGLEGYQFSTAVSILNAGYMLGQLPSNMIIPYIRPGLYLPACAIVWSGVSAAMAGVTSFRGLLVCRVFLGLVEAPLFPGAIYLISCWYTRREIAVRMALMSTGVPLANGFSGLIAAAVFSTLEGKHDLAGWKWLFIVLALCGAGSAVVAMILLPDYPHSRTGSAMWTMSEDMRKIAETRILADKVTIASETAEKTGVWHGLKLAVTDYKLWIFVMLNISISAAYGFSNFYPAVVRGFGYSRVITLVITFPLTLPQRLWQSPSPGALTSVENAAGITRSRLRLQWLAISTPEKKATSIAIQNVLSNIGNIMAPYFFVDSDEPRYLMAFILMFVMAGITISCAMLMKFMLWRTNKKLLKYALEHGTPYNPYIQ